MFGTSATPLQMSFSGGFQFSGPGDLRGRGGGGRSRAEFVVSPSVVRGVLVHNGRRAGDVRTPGGGGGGQSSRHHHAPPPRVARADGGAVHATDRDFPRYMHFRDNELWVRGGRGGVAPVPPMIASRSNAPDLRVG